MNRFLITRPDFDLTTEYLSQWSLPILDFALKKNITFSKLDGSKANKAEVAKFLTKQDHKLIILNGHGTDESICGQNREDIIKAGENSNLLKSRIVYAVSCSSSQVLGRKCVEEGCLSYIGYNDEFTFIIDNRRSTTPLKDKLAESFMIPSNEVSLSLLDGKTTGEAYKKSQDSFDKEINKLANSETEPGSETMLFALLWDKEIQEILGDNGARFA
jgi:hypothetical protein